MELYVEKELKDKIEPISEQLEDSRAEIEKIVGRLNSFDTMLRQVDRHYDGIVKAMLSKQGIILEQINEYNILKEFAKIAERE